MKQTVIVSTQPIGDVNHSAFVRTSLYLANKFPKQITLLDKDFELYNKPVDNIMIAYGTFYADFKNIMLFLDRNAQKRFFYLVNEYGLIPNGDIYRFLVKHNYDIIANFEEGATGARHYRSFNIVNMNVTALRDIDIEVPFEQRHKGLIYWGRWRPDRAIYFSKFLHDCTVSTASKNERFFQELQHKIKIIEPVNFISNSQIHNYKYTIYLEDTYTHTHYNHLSDRFYEALSVNLIMFFEKNTINTINKSNYPINPYYIVEDYTEMQKKIKEIETNPQPHIEYIKKLKALALKELETEINKLINILQSEIPVHKLTCPTCNKKTYRIYTCEVCGKKICPDCFDMYRKIFCAECFKKTNKRVEKQLTLF